MSVVVQSPLPIDLSGYPTIQDGPPGSINYNPASTGQAFTAQSVAVALFPTSSSTGTNIGGAQSTNVNIEVNSLGHASSGLVGSDLEVDGTIGAYSGVLLTGKILEFGYKFITPSSNLLPQQAVFDFRFRLTGGQLDGPIFPSTQDVALQLTGVSPQDSSNSLYDLAGFNATNPWSSVINLVDPKGPLASVAPLSVSGTVYCDNNLNGNLDTGETPEAGATVLLNGTDNWGNPVSLTTTSAADGTYTFTDLTSALTSGTYSVSIINPSTGHVQEQSHGAVVNPASSTVTVNGTNSTVQNVNLAEVEYGSIAGQVTDETSAGVPNVLISVAGSDYLGNSVAVSTDTDSSGNYSFSGPLALLPGNYTVTETVPAGDTAVSATAGTYATVIDATHQQVSLPGCDNSSAGDNFKIIVPQQPAINTVAGAPVIIGSGQKLTDTAILSGGFNPTGTITFTLTGPGNAVVDTETVTVTGDNTYSTPSGYLPTAAGTYVWGAAYSGDTNNFGAKDNGQNESEVVAPTGPAINTVAGGTVVIGSGAKLTDTAVLSGGYLPTGSITFTLTGPANTVLDTETVPVSGNGSYSTPAGYLPTATGTYLWSASYSGDSNNTPAKDNGQNENEAVSPTKPAINTVAGGMVVIGSGAKLTDTAVLSGGVGPTGTITFTLTGPGNAVVDTETVSVSGNGSYTTPSGYLPTVAGAYLWSASYSGDSNNSPAKDNGQNEGEAVSPTSPSIVTTPSTTSLVLGTSSVNVKDTAVLSGGYLPTGTITFTLVAPGGATVDTETVTVSGNGSYTTPTGYTLPTGGTVTGAYQWNASYTPGDVNNQPASELNSPNEQVKVSPASPQIVTTPNPVTITLSNAVPPVLKDSAVVSGGYSPTGSITFTLIAPGGTTVDTETVPVSGNGTYTTPTGYTLPVNVTVVGTYQWNATYSGDGNNNTAIENGATAEQVTVTPAPPTLVTTASGNVTLDSNGSPKLTDSADLEGAYNPAGFINFTLTGPGGTTVDSESIAVSHDGVYATPTGYTLPAGAVAGTYTWHATYTSSNGNNLNASDQGGPAEQTTVSPAKPAIVTVAGATVVLGSGQKLTDTASLSGGYHPTGIITFTLTGPGNAVVDTETVSVSGNGSYSTPTGYLPTLAGNYTWSANYQGDANNLTAKDNGQNEGEVVSPTSPAINTVAGGAVVVGSGAKLSDSAVLSGASSPTGTITFTLYSPSHVALYTDVVTVNGNGTYTTSTGTNPGGYLPTATGTYLWSATYSGDTNNAGATDNGQNENEVVSPSTPGITTTPSAVTTSTGGTGSYATIGFWHNQNGQATIKNFTGSVGNFLASNYPNLFGNSANIYTGTSLAGLTNAQVAQVYLNLWTPNGVQKNTFVQAFAVGLGLFATGGTAAGGTFNVGGDGAAYGVPNNTTLPISQILSIVNADFSPTSGFNAGIVSGLNDVLNNINMSGETPGGGGSVVTLTNLMDSATLSGGSAPGGTITFYLMGPGSTASTPLTSAVYTDTVTVNGDGTYTTATGNHAGGYQATATGTYQWVAVYSGDGSNISVLSPFGSEPWTVGQQAPTIVTTPSPAAVTLGTSTVVLKDSATLSGGVNPTGTITWTLSIGSTTVDTETVTVSGNGTYVTPHGYTLPTVSTVTGTYQWNAVYSGDANNNGDSFNNDPTERVVVSPASPSIATTPNVTSATCGAGTTAKDTAVLSGGYSPKGTITFTLVAPGGTTVDTETVTVNGNGTYSTPTGYAIGASAATGTYQWNATFTATDGNDNNASDINDKSEQFVVGKPTGGTISGTKYQDLTGNGFSADDTPLKGVVINLYADSNNNNTFDPTTDKIVATTTTAADGTYSFGNVAAGHYFVDEVVPAGAIETGPYTSSAPGYYSVTVAAGGTYGGENFDNYIDNCNLNDFSGIYYVINGTRKVTELSGNVMPGDSVKAYVTVAPNTNDELTLVSYNAPDAYFNANDASQQTIYQQQTVQVKTGSTSQTFCIGPVTVPSCDFQIDFVCGPAIDHFGPAGSNIFYHQENRFIDSANGGCTGAVQKGQFATIGFWHNKNGQAVIYSFNGSSTSTALGNWLASSFPNLFGTANAFLGSSLAGKTNAQVAAMYNSLWNPSGVTKNSFVQAFAVALGVYADTSSLGGNSTAASFGFNINSMGGLSATFNVGANGAAFGVANNTTLMVGQILQAANNNFNSSTGLFYGGNSTLTADLNNVLNGINTGGDIALTASGAAVNSETADQPLATSLAPMMTGSFVVAVDVGSDPNGAAEYARIGDAIASLNSILAANGVTLVEIRGDDSVAADIHIHISDTSVIGGMDQGVLGVTQAGGEITLISGWNYYYGSDASAVTSDQYDFESVAAHELGHGIGLGHSTDANSVMFPYLQTGVARRTLTDNDMAIIDSDGGTVAEPLKAAKPNKGKGYGENAVASIAGLAQGQGGFNNSNSPFAGGTSVWDQLSGSSGTGSNSIFSDSQVIGAA